MLEFDDILVRIGQFGRVQVGLYLLLGLIGIPCGMQNLLMVFMGAEMEHWCDVPGLNNLTMEQALNVSAIMEDDHTLSTCRVFDVNYTQYSVEELINWNRSLAGYKNKTICSQWKYDRSEFKSTVRSQWDLVCDQDYIVALMQTIYMCGFLLGTITFGIISDKIGRLKTMMLCCLLMILLSVAAALVSVYWHFVAFTIIRFFNGICVAGFFTVTFVLIMEIISPKWRCYTGLFFQGFFAAGFCILPGISFALRDMFTTQLAASLPAIVLLSYFFFIPESPRWLIQQGRFDEATVILKTMGRLNKKPLPHDFTVEGYDIDSSGKLIKQGDKLVKHSATFIDVLKSRRLRNRYFIAAYCWFVSGLAYYGLSYSAESLGGDIFLNTLISGLVEFPAYIISFFVVAHPRIGRKWGMSVSFFITSVSLLVCVGVLSDKKLHIPLIILANIGKLGISAAFAIVYIFTAEIFPTVVRSVCVGASSMFARVGALLAPQIMLLWKFWYGAPYLVFGLMALAAGLLTLLLPESVGQVLPETIEDGELFGTEAYRDKHHLHDLDENQEESNSDPTEMKLLDDVTIET